MVASSLRLVRGSGHRQLRIACGLVMFTYLLSHFTAHSAGNVSYEAMKRALAIHMAIWRLPPIAFLLYAAATTHACLGLWALYNRRHFHWKTAEVSQLALGLSIPAFMLQHLIGQRLPPFLWDSQRYYAHAFNLYLVNRPDQLLLTLGGLVAAWIHACIGLFFWLRMKRPFPRIAPFMLAIAVLLPVMAVLGIAHGGREYVRMSQSPQWRAAEYNPVPQPDHQALTNALKPRAALAWIAIVAVVLAGRGARRWRERRSGSLRLTYPGGQSVAVPLGYTVLEASLLHGISHASVCGGRARCSTCRVRVLGDCSTLPPPSRRERFVLDRVGAGSNPSVRLACQLRPRSDIAVVPLLPANVNAATVRRRQRMQSGAQRYVVAMFVDMRGSTALAESRLPFDTMFIVNRFLASVSAAVSSSGGRPNQFTGDGLLALFGLDCDRETGCRQAFGAIRAIGDSVAQLNSVMRQDLPAPIDFGIGVHAGKVVVGELGSEEHFVYTALGDAVNVAARLQDMTKSLQCQALVSEEVRKVAALPAEMLPSCTVSLRGRQAPLDVCTIVTAQELDARWREASPAA